MVDNRILEEMVHDFIGDQTEKKFARVMETLERATVFVPAMPPEKMTRETIKRIMSGENVPSSSENKPQPFLMKKQDGTTVLPVFTAKEQIPEDKRTPILLQLPYATCVKLVYSNMDKIPEIVLNPFTEGLTINRPPIEVAYRRLMQNEEREKQIQALREKKESGNTSEEEEQNCIQVSEKEFRRMVNKRASTVLLPMFFLDNPQGAMEQFLEQKEELILDIYRSIYPDSSRCEYTEDDFSVLVLNVTDSLKIVRVDLPEVKPQIECAIRFYLTLKEGGELRYYVVLRGIKEEENLINRIFEDKHFETVMTLEDYGSEITEIMELAQKE